jgi:predicted transposase YbfD/YdcC
LETRKLTTFAPDIPYLRLGYIYDNDWRKQVKVVIKLEKTVNHYRKKKLIKNTTETSYFMSTTGVFSAKELNEIIRGHWGIENKNHYVRDETLKEDRSQIRKNAAVFARLRSFGLNLMRNMNIKNIAREIHKNTLNMEEMLRVYFRVE